MADLKQLVINRGHVKARLTRFKSFLETLATTTPVDVLQERLENNADLLKLYDAIQNSIDELVAGTDAAAEHDRERDAFETLFFDVITKAKQIIRSRQPRALILNSSRSDTGSSTPVSTSEPQVKLPTISLPQFNGDYSQWVKFRDTFESLIHTNDSLHNIQKFHYLNSALKGDAARLIAAYGISDANYLNAWQSVKNRYEDKRALIDHHIRSLYELPAVTRESSNLLRQLLDDANNHLLAMKALGEPVHSWDTPIVYLISSKLDPRTKREWQRHASKKTVEKTVTEINAFLQEHLTYLEGCVSEQQTTSRSITSNVQNTSRNRGQRNVSLLTHSVASCPLCREAHALSDCEQFQILEPQARYTKSGELKVCFNCLKPGHANLKCRRPPCKKCSKRHHSLLHVDGMIHGPVERKHSADLNTQTTRNEPIKQSYVASTSSIHDCVMLSTAIVKVLDKEGQVHECRALLDQGSQINLIKKSFCDRVGLRVDPAYQLISGVGLSGHSINGKTSVTIASNVSNYETTLPCLVMEAITIKIPSSPISANAFRIPVKYKLADPTFNIPRDIELVIGNGDLCDMLCGGKYKLGRGLPTLLETRLGWTLAGRLIANAPAQDQSQACHTVITNTDLDNNLRRFWEIEHISGEKSNNSIFPTNPCEQHFRATTTRDPQGRFIVDIPFKGDLATLGSNYKLAEKRFLAIERKLNRSAQLKSEYSKFIEEYQTLNHLREVKAEYLGTSEPRYYLPHHAVIKESTTTKLRVVFDGSAKSEAGTSLNELQRVGPTVQSDLLEIILRFRTHRYVISADIAKMYRQVKVAQQQWPLQRILWRTDKSQPIKIYELTTVTYGTAAAPFLATRALRQLGEEAALEHPEASKAIINDFYVDDLLTGGQTIDEVRKLKHNITSILKTAGFELRKWGSNDSRVLQSGTNASGDKDLNSDKEPKTLGLLWSTERDTLRYGVNTYTLPRKITKRVLLSEISKVFDPLGLVGPVVVRIKLLIQQLWQLNISWDEQLSDTIIDQWITLRNSLNHLNSFEIPRRAISMKAVKIELHGFCDASQRAYGACVYLRSTDCAGNHSIYLLCAKSRVAPLKTISLPRLELCGALLLAQLVAKVRQSLRVPIASEHLWCDSTITLAWIEASPSRWNTFVANRITEIQQLTTGTWRHVISEDNPADVISRGLDPIDLRDSKLWWHGPKWLQYDLKDWPVCEQSPPDNLPEAKPIACMIAATKYEDVIFYKYSSLNKLLRVTAYCERFMQGIRKKGSTATSTILTPKEIDSAEKRLIRVAQLVAFPDEFKNLSNGQEICKTSKLKTLNPFIDEKGCLRVGGRLEHSTCMSYNEKHPLILPSNHSLTQLIIKHEHIRLMHAGCQATIASLRSRYWPLSAKNNTKFIIRRCIPCFRVKPISLTPTMGSLPADRITPRRPFYTCGVDYAGPFTIKDRVRSRITSKAYICVFICFTTKAVHLELAIDLSSQAFLRCLRRLMARRGRIHTLYSDNGTNFVGARNELADLSTLLKSNEFQKTVSAFAVNEKLQWHMIPPHAPHFGGLWEGAVKSAKYHLKRVVGEAQLTYEEFYTVLTQIEMCMNSRPISPLSHDPKDFTPLTPGHFLIGEPLSMLPEPDLLEVKEGRLIRYQLLQKLFQQFWKRWSHDYLHQLQQRHKWHIKDKTQLTKGTMVIVKEDNLPPLQWRLGRIEELHPGKDGVIRVVSIKVSNGTIKRPTTKICVLPIQSDSTA